MTARPSPARSIRTDPDTGVLDLIRRLGDDSKRLINDEIRLAKLETKESMHTASRGALWLGVGFGIAVVALTALTVLVASLTGRMLGENYWAGALITGVLWLVIGAVMVKRGLIDFHEPSYTLEETREEARETARWVSSEIRADRENGKVLQ